MGDARLSRLLDAVLAVSADLDLDTVLQDVVEAARDLVGARYAALGVVGDDAFLSRFLHSGMADNLVASIGHLPEGHGILGFLISHPEPLRLDDLTAHPASVGVPEHHPPMGSFLGAPIRVRGTVFGNLYLTEKEQGPFDADDEELVVALAAVAGASISNANLHAEVQRLSIVEDRERIGRDLHDTVIQRLFATGLGLQAIAKRLGSADEALAERVVEAVDELDETIREIRTVIFSLRSDRGGGLREAVADLTQELVETLGFRPALRFDGPVDLVSDMGLRREMLSVLREALTNVARHAAATRVEVDVATDGQHLELVVRDNGVGPPEQARSGGLGLGNIVARAERLGGTAALVAGPAGRGAQLRFRVPT